MPQSAKTTQLQLRVSPAEKREIQRRAKSEGSTVSAWVLKCILPYPQMEFQSLLFDLAKTNPSSFGLAALHDFLAKQSNASFELAVGEAPRASLSEFLRSYVAAMVEHTAVKKRTRTPDWALKTGPLRVPYFATELSSLRLHLLTESPPAFRRRNLFVDDTVGGRV